jgi:hypothetical protein
MTAGGFEYTLYFAWVPPDTPWDLSLARFDENVFDLVLDHEEGQIPSAIVEVVNPGEGLLNGDVWCWISFSYEACEPQPLFHGHLFGVPEDIINTTIVMKFIARAEDYAYQKQQVARSLKVLPNYDKIFFDVSKRDDPDAILEGWSALYHVDRINNRVSASDILLGEDGTVTFAEQDVFYDSVKYRTLQSPLIAVNVKMDVQWEQQYRGYIYVGNWAYPTLGSDAFVGDWPKSGSSLGGGWFAGVSWAGERDPSIEEQMLLNAQQQNPQQQSTSFNWTNQEKQHRTGDTMSISINYTPPFGNQILINSTYQIGIINPNNVDINGDPDPLNIPAKVSMDWFCYKPFALNFDGKQSLASLGLVYMADRKRSEKLEMTITADVQPVLIDPTVAEDTEQITLKSGDLSLPITDMLNWDTVGMGGAVTIGQLIFPDNPLVPGQTSSQIALNSGNTGMVFPTFSNIAGQTTQDGSVTWVSLGSTPPSEGAQDWVRLARVPLGTLLLPKPISGVPDLTSTMIPGQMNYPPTGTAVPRYSIFSAGNSGPGDTMSECTEPGILGGLTAAQAVFHTFTNPTGAFMYIAVQAGQTGEFHTTFNEAAGAQTVDGTVIWQCLGPVELPIGGWPGMTPAASYFSTDRGQLSVQHGFCRGRAKLRKRARAAQVSFDTRFEVAAQLSCRMNGAISDIRLPGGQVSGKIIAYRLEAHGKSGIFKGSVTLGCSVGTKALGSMLRVLPVPDPGIPSYVGVTGPPNGYVKPGYQRYYSTGTTLTPGDPDWQPPGTPVAQPVTGGGEGPSGQGPITPPNWPVLPPTLPPVTCPPLNSTWAAGPTDVGNEIFFTPPVGDPNDDGIIFPPSPSDLILRQAWHGIASTLNPINLAIYNLQLQQIVHNAIASAKPTKQLPLPRSPIGVSVNTITVPNAYDIQVAVQLAVLKNMLQGTGLWFELVLKPLTNGPFINYYVVDSSPLPILQTIDLSA